MVSADTFYSASLVAGAILSGFCGTFLSFRIQREANYYRQPVVNPCTGEGIDVHLGLSHFTSSFLLLIIATLLAIIFGFVLPLLALYGLPIAALVIVIGIIDSLIFIAAYFTCEMLHYHILNVSLVNDPKEWGESRTLVSVTIIIVCVLSILTAVFV